ncbi:MAG: hypothetical protein ABIU84_16850 [Thermoanaerobaculia bacterium]
MNRFRATEPDPLPTGPRSAADRAVQADIAAAVTAASALSAVADDQALLAWFELLPTQAPRPGFVMRVMSALPRRSWLDERWSRSILVAALAAVAVSAGFLLPALVPLARLVGPAGVLNLWISAVADLATHLTAGLSTWSAFASVGRVLGHALSLPPFLALLALNAALALAAFRGLVALSSKRSPSHVGIVSLAL